MLIAVGIVYGMDEAERQNEKRNQHQWEEICTERFLKELSQKGYCAYEDYLQFHEALNYYGVTSTIGLEEYRKEQDIEGKSYFYLISWDELREKLEQDRIYYFSEGSTVRIEVFRTSRRAKTKHDYFGRVDRKER